MTHKSCGIGDNDGKLVASASLTYNQPVTRSEEGMPIGNGTMGSLVWTTPSAIKFQINRVDVFGNNSRSNNFYERHSDYCGGVGFVDVDFLTEDIFAGKDFHQHLSPYNGVVTVEGSKVHASALAWNEQDVIALKVSDNRPMSQIIQIKLRALRPLIARTGNHTARAKLNIVSNKIILTQEFLEDEYYCASSLVLEILCAPVTAAEIQRIMVEKLLGKIIHPTRELRRQSLHVTRVLLLLSVCDFVDAKSKNRIRAHRIKGWLGVPPAKIRGKEKKFGSTGTAKHGKDRKTTYLHSKPAAEMTLRFVFNNLPTREQNPGRHSGAEPRLSKLKLFAVAVGLHAVDFISHN